MARNSKNQTAVTKDIKTKALLISACFVLFALIVCGNMFRIQIVNYEQYKTAATEVQLRETELSARRGTIYDANMKVLAQSATVWTVFVSPKELDARYSKDDMANYTREQLANRTKDLVATTLSDILLSKTYLIELINHFILYTWSNTSGIRNLQCKFFYFIFF